MIMFHGNYGSILISFRDCDHRTDNGRTDDGRALARVAYIALRRGSNETSWRTIC